MITDLIEKLQWCFENDSIEIGEKRPKRFMSLNFNTKERSRQKRN